MPTVSAVSSSPVSRMPRMEGAPGGGVVVDDAVDLDPLHVVRIQPPERAHEADVTPVRYGRTPGAAAVLGEKVSQAEGDVGSARTPAQDPHCLNKNRYPTQVVASNKMLPKIGEAIAWEEASARWRNRNCWRRSETATELHRSGRKVGFWTSSSRLPVITAKHGIRLLGQSGDDGEKLPTVKGRRIYDEGRERSGDPGMGSC